MFQLLPFIEYIKYSTRNAGVDQQTATLWSLKFKNLLTIINPFILGNPANGTYWGFDQFWISTFYNGIITAICCSLGFFTRKYLKINIVLGTALLFCIILSLGNNTPVYSLFYKYIPGFKMIRNPAAIMYLYVFITSILAGFGIYLIQNLITLKKPKRIENIILIISITAVIIILLLNLINFKQFNSEKIIAIRHSIIYSSVLILILSIITYLLLSKLIRPVLFSAVVVLIVYADLLYSGWYILPKSERSLFNVKTRITEYLKKDRSTYRIAATPFSGIVFNNRYFNESTRKDGILNTRYYYECLDLLIPNTNIYFNISSIEGYDPMTINRYIDLLEIYYKQLDTEKYNNFLNLLNVKYLLSYEKITNKDFKYILTSGNIKLYENKNYFKRAFIVNNIKYCRDNDEMIQMMYDKTNKDYAFILGKENKTAQNDNSIKNTAEIIHIKSNEIQIHVNNKTDLSYLILTDNYYPGWKVEVDGKQRECLNVNYTFKAVKLQNNDKNVRFYYVCRSFYIGLLISISTLALIFILSKYKIINRIFI